MKKLLFCLVLAACVLLSGCSKPKPTWSTGLEAAPSVTEPDTGGLGAFLVCDEQLDDGVQFQLYDDGRLVLSGGDILQSVPDSLLFQMYQDKITSLELTQRIGITPANLSILKTGKAKAVRLSTMDAICRELQCQPGDLFEFVEDDDPWKR